MSGFTALPGFIDIHIHGGNGGDFSDASKESSDKISSYLAKHGVTSFCGTSMTLDNQSLTNIVKSGRNMQEKKQALSLLA